MKLIIGLGNPGEKYVGTRHNLGFEVVDEIAKRMDNGQWTMDNKFKSELLRYTLYPSPYTLVKPQTYMNNSGQAVLAVTEYFKIKPQDIIVVHDDVDLPLGKIKIRLGGSAAGHHGVESIISTIGDQFIRVRLGIGPEANLDSVNVEHFVLEKFMPNEKTKVKRMVKRAAEAVQLLLEKGLETAQNQYN